MDRTGLSTSIRTAYFSMEVALDPAVPTYSGGLGVLAGDFLRAAADQGAPLIGISLVHRKGYFRQRIDADGMQSEEAAPWSPDSQLEAVGERVQVQIEGRRVQVAAWCWWVKGFGTGRVPVLLLDTDVAENSAWDRSLTDHLYGGDSYYRFCQEVILGMGGVEMLRALGLGIQTFHMNEGHSALLSIALLEQRLGTSSLSSATSEDVEAVRQQCVFTTHTPVPAGHDQFSRDLMRQVLGPERAGILEVTQCCPQHALNMTYLALRFSRYINGVAMQHGDISQSMFPKYPIHSITNGVHAASWVGPAMGALLDQHIPDWRSDNQYLRYAIKIPVDAIRGVHLEAKQRMLAEVARLTGRTLSDEVFTIGFGRRAATYKRPDLLFSFPDQLRWMAAHIGPLRVVMAGKAHPQDDAAKALIRGVFHAAHKLRGAVEVVYLEDYGVGLGALMTSGVDLWLNTPQRPNEASGTSGMKAALNGVPSLSVLDGWWIEGCLEGITGWAIGHGGEVPEDPATEAGSLYAKLEGQILPMFYNRPHAFGEVMRHALAINGSFFNTHRMLSQYLSSAYGVSVPQ